MLDRYKIIYYFIGKGMEIYKVKISSKGQITLPKKVRESLGAIILEIIITDNQVVVKPVESVKSLAGSLKRYTKNVPKKLSMKEVKDKAWEEHVKEKFSSH